MPTGQAQPSSRPTTRLPRPVSTAMLSRATSSLSLNPVVKDSIVVQLDSQYLPGSSIPLPIPLKKQPSRLPTVSKSTATLRLSSASTTTTHLPLRPSRLQPKITQPTGPLPAEQRRSSGLRKVSSTHFKENFFAPPPGVPPIIGRGEKGGFITKKKSQISLLRPAPSLARLRTGVDTGERIKVGNETRAVNVMSYEETTLHGAGKPQSRGLQIDHTAFTPQPSPPYPPPLRLHTPGSRPLVPLHQIQPSAIPAHLLSSPWKGPRISIEQIKDTEFSFTEEDSIDLSSGSSGPSRNLVLSRSAMMGSTSGSSQTGVLGSPRPRSKVADYQTRMSQPHGRSQLTSSESGMNDLLKEKEKEIQMLRLELSVERQMLGRVGREAADKIQAAREGYEVDKLAMADDIKRTRRELVRGKYEMVEHAAQVLLVDIESQKEMIKRLKGILL